jgi:hypothetical protein
MQRHRTGTWCVAQAALLALVVGAEGRALAQSLTDDLAGTIGAVTTHTVTDANGLRTTRLTLQGSFGEATFVLDDKQTTALLGEPGSGSSPDFSRLAPLYATHMKDALGATDEEWAVLSAKILKVRSLAMQIKSHGRTGGKAGVRSELDKAWRALDAILKNKASKAEEIKAAMRVVDREEAAVKVELDQTRKDLAQIVTVRQETLLVRLGILE